MPTIIHSLKTRQPYSAVTFKNAHRRPHYDCQEQMDALKLAIYVPGVDPAGVNIEVRGPDLIVTAPKSHLVRANWRAAHLENAQRDYQLRLRLGFSLDYDAMQAALNDGVLTITIPKKSAVAAAWAMA
jgi:HSP20 family molecular chaperone IbpA